LFTAILFLFSYASVIALNIAKTARYGPDYMLKIYTSFHTASSIAHTLILLTVACGIAVYYIRTRRGIYSLIPLAIIDLWLSVPRGYGDSWVNFKWLLLFFGLIAVAGFLSRRTSIAAAGISLFVISTLAFDYYSTNGFPDRYDAFTKAPYVEFLQNKNTGNHRVVGGHGILFPNFASAVGLQDIRYITALTLNTFHDFRARRLHMDIIDDTSSSSLWFTGRDVLVTGKTENGTDTFKMLKPEMDISTHLKYYSFLGVKYIVMPKNTDLVAAARTAGLEEKPFELIYDDEVRIYENKVAAKRVFVVRDVKKTRGYEEAQNLIATPGFDMTKTAVIETKLPSVRMIPSTLPDKAAVTSYGYDTASITAELPSPGLLVFTDTYYPGWRAYVDGVPAEILRVDGLVRGVFLSEGAHEVIFEYRPESFKYGIVLFLAAACVSSVMFAYGFMGKKTQNAP